MPDANLAQAEHGLTWLFRRWGAVPRCQSVSVGFGRVQAIRANVRASKEEHSCQTSEMTKNDRAFIA